MVKVAGEEVPDNTACITCVHVLDGHAVELISRDEQSEWQFLCGQAVHETFEARVISLAEALELDGRLATLAPLALGEVRSV